MAKKLLTYGTGAPISFADRREIEEIERPFRESVARGAIDKFPKDIRGMIRKSVAQRQPQEHQLAKMAMRQLDYGKLDVASKLKGDAKEHYE